MSRRIVAIAAVLLLVAGAAVAVGARGDDDSGDKTYELLFDNAFGLTEGGDFKVAGVRAGETSGFKVTKVDGRALALVTAKVTEPGLADLRRDARCEIRPQSLLGEYFVDCQPGASDERDRPRQRHHPAAVPRAAAPDRRRARRRPGGQAG